MARITNFLKLWLPEANEVYNVEKDQNENFEKIDTKLKEWDTGKENTITKKTAFNLDKTNLTENDSNKLFTAKGALDLFNNLTTAISTAVEAAKTALRVDIAKKIDKTSKSDSVNSTSSETVATSAAVKTAYDKAEAAIPIIDNTLVTNLNTVKGTKFFMVNGGATIGMPTDSSFSSGDFNVAQFDSQEQRVQIIFNNYGVPFLRTNDASRNQENYENAWGGWYKIWSERDFNPNTKLNISYCPYNVGDIYLTTSATNPAVLWTGTTWQKIEGKFLRATTSGQNAGINGGSDTKTLTVANLPAHSHSGSTNSAGAHSHTQSAHSHTQPAHKHNLHTDYTGNSSLTGRKGFAVEGGASQMGLSSAYIKEAGGEQTGAATPAIQSAGEHTHTVSIGNTGNGTAFDVVPAYMTVHIWKRVS